MHSAAGSASGLIDQQDLRKSRTECAKLEHCSTSQDDPGRLEGGLHDPQLEVRAHDAQQVVEVGDRQVGIPGPDQLQGERNTTTASANLLGWACEN